MSGTDSSGAMVEAEGLAARERALLADLFGVVGPDRPTLCEGWNTRDLLAHLLIRERRPDAAMGIVIKPLAGWTRRVSDGYAALSWNGAIEKYRSGPPLWNPMRLRPVDEALNGVEMFVHHEDVRRGEAGWRPRTFTAGQQAELAGLLRPALVRTALHGVRVGVRAQLTGTAGLTGTDTSKVLRAGSPGVTVTGEPGEVLMWLSRRSAVVVDVTGDPVAVTALADAGFAVSSSLA